METRLIDTNEIDEETMEKGTAARSSDTDVLETLKLTGHRTTAYPNGLTLGVKLESVPGTRGVHVDVVYALDLRRATFGKGGLAIRAAVLETISRDLDKVLNDVGLGELLHEHAVLTPWGHIRLPLLQDATHGSLSLMHETRTVYVIVENAKPTFDLTWLTETSRIVAADQFALISQSDSRSKLSDLKKTIGSEKWQLLETGLAKGWFGVLALLSLIIGLSTSFTVLLAGSDSLIMPALVSLASGVASGWLLRSSRICVLAFQEALGKERERLCELGDATRITRSIVENEDRLQLIADLNFTVSPLMAAVGTAISDRDVDTSVSVACSVLDECVRLAPRPSDSSLVIRGDDGLRHFIGLFEHLGGNIDEASLALAYVGLTGHLTKRITFGEAVAHLTELNNALYDIGALRPNIKEALDDRLNMIGLKETVDEIDKEIRSAEEPTLALRTETDEKSVRDESQQEEAAPLRRFDSLTEDDELHDQIRQASVEATPEDELAASVDSSTKISDSTEEVTIVATDIITGRMKKQKTKSAEPAQLLLVEDFEYTESSSEAKEERGSAGV